METNIETILNEGNDAEPPLHPNNTNENIKRPLTTKNAIEFLLNRTLQSKVCRYCLNVTSELVELDMMLHVGGQKVLYEITVKDMIANFYPFQVTQDPDFPNKICNQCLNRTVSTYLFTQQCEQSERALRNCLDDVYEKVEKLDPLERKKKRGKPKAQPNHNKIYAAHETVLDYAEPIIHLVNRGSALINSENTPKANELECLKCWQLLPNIESLINHDKIHPKSMWYHCRQCGGSFAKRLHLKRHVTNQHSTFKNDTVAAPTKKSFECQTCGQITETYQNYLQHAEKHKLKKVLQQVLLEKNDELCTVCLRKENKMDDLETMMAFNGPCPELNGDKSLYHIVGSALPHLKETYKYQELVVSKTATVLKITQKTTKTIENEMVIANKEKGFVFTRPIKMINVILNLEGKCYTFDFSKPDITINNADEGTANVKDVEERKEENSFLFSHPVETINLSLNLEGQTYTFGFPKPNYTVSNADKEMPNVNEVVATKNIEEKAVEENNLQKHDLCKTCWIFTTPQCEKCLKQNNAEDKIEITNVANNTDADSQNTKDVPTAANPCPYCWLYKSLNKCDFCQKLIVKETDIADENETQPSDNETEELTIKRKHEVDTNLVDKKETRQKKRTINDALTASKQKPVKKLIWQCHVCFTPNDGDRHKCICCESNESIEQANKINFGCRKEVIFDIPGKLNIGLGNNQVTEDLKIGSQEENNNEHATSNNESVQEVEVSELMDTNTNSNLQVEFNQTADFGSKVTELMDVNYEENTNQKVPGVNQILPFFTGYFENTLIPTTQEIMPIFQNTDLTPLASNSYSFNIGSGVGEKKAFMRNKRPIRKRT